MKWFTAEAFADNPRKAHVVIDKPIGSDWAPDWIADFTGEKAARDFIAEVDALGELDEIILELNSPGGDVASGVRIMNYLKNHQASVHVRVTGMAASIATVIMMAGDTRTMGIGTTIMTHRASSLMVGFFNAKEMEETARNLSKFDAALVDAYVSATSKTAAQINALLDQGDTIMGADEAIEWGFATDKDAKLAAVASADIAPFLRQLKQEGEIVNLRAQLAGKEPNAPAGMSAADALALAFDVTPEEAEAQAADLGDKVIALRTSEGQARSLAEKVAEALGLEVSAILEGPEAASLAISGLRSSPDEIVASERSRVVAIAKACQTTGQTHLIEKLVNNGMSQEQAGEYIFDVAAASGNRQDIHNSHSPEGGQQGGINYDRIYARQNRSKVTA